MKPSSSEVRFLLVVLGIATASCSAGAGESDDDRVATTAPSVTFQEFEARTFRDQDGIYIVDGDTPIANIKLLHEFYDGLYSGQKLIVQKSGGGDAAWSASQKGNLTYCVSDGFGANKSKVVQGMADATGAWEGVANVKFVYLPAQDASCTAANGSVVFDVRQTTGQSYLARAFFPNQSRSSRNVIVDTSSFNAGGGWTLTGVLRHELGHALGFRHEHTRPEAATCFEDSDWRALTAYDKRSVMHYPQCNGANTGLVLTQLDADGARSLYGAPGSAPPPPPPPGGDKTFSGSGSVAPGESDAFGPFDVTTRIKVTISGTGDADLYVRFGSAPTTTRYNCRPYEADSSETCELDVPAGATKAYVTVRGDAAATYSIAATYR